MTLRILLALGWKWGQCLKFQLLTFKIISALEHFVFKISFWGHSHLQCSDCLPTHIKVYLLSFAKVKLGH